MHCGKSEGLRVINHPPVSHSVLNTPHLTSYIYIYVCYAVLITSTRDAGLRRMLCPLVRDVRLVRLSVSLDVVLVALHVGLRTHKCESSVLVQE